MVPKTIGPQEQTVPIHLVPMDKWSPRQLVPLDICSPKFVSGFFNFSDIGWSTLDTMNDFKPISNKNYLRFGEINFLFFVQKHFFFQSEMVHLGKKLFSKL